MGLCDVCACGVSVFTSNQTRLLAVWGLEQGHLATDGPAQQRGAPPAPAPPPHRCLVMLLQKLLLHPFVLCLPHLQAQHRPAHLLSYQCLPACLPACPILLQHPPIGRRKCALPLLGGHCLEGSRLLTSDSLRYSQRYSVTHAQMTAPTPNCRQRGRVAGGEQFEMELVML